MSRPSDVRVSGPLLVFAAGFREDLARLGKIEHQPGDSATTRMDMIVPRGSPPEVKWVELAHQVVEFTPATLGLSAAEDAADDAQP